MKVFQRQVDKHGSNQGRSFCLRRGFSSLTISFLRSVAYHRIALQRHISARLETNAHRKTQENQRMFPYSSARPITSYASWKARLTLTEKVFSPDLPPTPGSPAGRPCHFEPPIVMLIICIIFANNSCLVFSKVSNECLDVPTGICLRPWRRPSYA
jgi:hypothetical protein